MYQTTNVYYGIVDGMTKKAGLIPSKAGMLMSTLFAAPVGYSAYKGLAPAKGITKTVFGNTQRAKLVDPVKSPQISLF